MRLLVFIIFVHSLASQDLLPSLLEETSLRVELKQADGSIKKGGKQILVAEMYKKTHSNYYPGE